MQHDTTGRSSQVVHEAKFPKPASTIFPNSVNGDPVLPLPHPKHHSLLFSYNPHPSCQQVFWTLPSTCAWSVTPSLHSHCSHSGPDHRRLSPRLFWKPPHLYPPSPFPTYCLFSVKHRSDSLKPQTRSVLLLLLLECPQAPPALSPPSLPSLSLCSPASLS